MLAYLLNIPQTPTQWLEWSFHHRQSHDAIRAAILAKGGPRLVDYQVEPINQNAAKFFLQNNQQLHIDANAVLGIQSSDLLDADISSERGLSEWIQGHYLEHYDMQVALGI